MPVLRLMQQVLASAAMTHTDPLEAYDIIRERRLSRRRFMRNAAMVTLALSGGSWFWGCRQHASQASQPRIVIVGAGLAGLYLAYLLKLQGIQALVYEASPRAGGRILTVPDLMGEGLWTEYGGEFIDSTHSDMLFLCAEFQLPLLDRQIDWEAGIREFCYFFENRYVYERDIIRALRPYASQIMDDSRSLSEHITFDNHSELDRRLDAMSIMEYVDSLGIRGWLRELIRVSYTAEYGTDAHEQSAINMLSIVHATPGGSFDLYGTSDERYSILGGNSRLIQKLVQQLTGQIHFEHTLLAITQKNSTYQLTFKKPSGAWIDLAADVVVLTIPFTCLREVDLNLVLPDWKRRAIHQLAYGMNSKLLVGVSRRVWREHGYGGYAFSDNGIMNGYDHTQMQQDNRGPGGYTIFLGGKESMNCILPTLEELQRQYVPALDELFPGVAGTFNGVFQRWHWPSYVYAKASYVSYAPTQYTTLSGAIERPVGNLFFAGEHCSYEFQGFMNGAAHSARKVANIILDKLAKPQVYLPRPGHGHRSIVSVV